MTTAPLHYCGRSMMCLGFKFRISKKSGTPVPYAEDGVVVNIGDLLQRWTNDYFVSTKHRVVNSHMTYARYSMPHFVDPTPGTIVKQSA